MVVPGYGGWAEVTWRETITAYVRFVPGDEQPWKLRMVELRVTEPWLHLHRDLPLSRIENAVHADVLVRYELLQHIERPMSDDFASFFEMKQAIEKGMSERYRLERPATRRLGDDHYRAVAEAYRDAVAFGLNPRKTLAIDSDTPADTVARWIRKAREKGYLTAAEPGKASGALPETKEEAEVAS